MYASHNTFSFKARIHMRALEMSILASSLISPPVTFCLPVKLLAGALLLGQATSKQARSQAIGL
jgi:hypothetical protein